jgi:lysophospholipase L1-like esterase
MIFEWQKISKPGQLGILILPSKEQVFEEWLVKNKNNYNQLSEFSQYTNGQIKLQEIIENDCIRYKIPFENALNDMVDLVQAVMNENGDIDALYPDESHPNKRGYLMYSKAAQRLYNKMISQSNKLK